MQSRWALALLLLASAPAVAKAAPPVAVAPVKAPASYGRSALEKALLTALEAAAGPVTRPARVKSKLRSGARSPSSLAAAARSVGASRILDVQITKQGWLYTARAVLVNAASGEVEMDFRSQFYKPKSEAADRGRRIAKTTAEKLAELQGPAGPAPGADEPSAQGTNRSPVAGTGAGDRASSGSTSVSGAKPESRREVDPTRAKLDDEPPSARPGARSTAAEAARDVEAAPASTRTGEAAPASTRTGEAAPASTRTGEAALASRGEEPPAGASPPTDNAAGPATTSAQLEASGSEASGGRWLGLRIGLTAGAGLLRTYDLSSPAVDRSSLSYRLDPLSLFDLRTELGLGPVLLEVRGSLRPVAYELAPETGGASVTPRGLFVDAQIFAGYALSLGRLDGGEALLVPRVGARLTVHSVDENPGPLLLDSTAVTGLAGLAFRLPLGRIFELGVGFEGGPILSYQEGPSTTGAARIGWAAGGDLDARVWLTDALAIAFDNRFIYESVGFDGAPDRPLPINEQNLLQEAQLGVRDLRTTLGVMLRL